MIITRECLDFSSKSELKIKKCAILAHKFPINDKNCKFCKKHESKGCHLWN